VEEFLDGDIDLSVVVFTVLQLIVVDLVGDLKMQNLTPFSGPFFRP